MTRKIRKKADRNQNQNGFENDNLGLDADHSSDAPSLMTRLDDDNDRISGNPDGENDVIEKYNILSYSLLDYK